MRILLLVTLTVCVWAAPKDVPVNGQNIDDVIASIFGKPLEDTTTAGNVGNTIKPSTIVPSISSKSQELSSTGTKCTTGDGDSGECVRYYQCSANNSVITDGVGLIDIRASSDNCPSYLDVCCLLSDKSDPILPPPEKLSKHEGCGWRNPNGVGFRITGDKDNEAKFGEFPWIVAILKIELVNEEDPDGQKLNVYVGGGSLIHPSVVLTAAHYVVTTKALRIRAGEWDTQTTKEIYPYQDRDVKSVSVHKDFNRYNLFYDIAVLFLSTPLEMAPNVRVVCLPPPRERVSDGTQCLASGWGKNNFGKDGRYQVILKRVELPVVDRSQCQSQLRKTRLGRHFELHSSFMCAGGVDGQDTCKGDGGSPLVCPVSNEIDRYMQSGIVAWGIGCGEDGIPGVYVDVSNLRSWIDDQVIGQGFGPSVYTI